MAFPQVVALLITKLPEVWGLARLLSAKLAGLALASSSRSQVAARTASAAARLTWDKTVRECPLAAIAVDGDCYSLGYSVRS